MRKKWLELHSYRDAQALVVAMSTIETSFAILSTKSISSALHEDFAALRVAIEVMNATESFLWVRFASCRHAI
jgi:hypothetical protein